MSEAIRASEFWETQKAKLSDKTLEVVEKLPKAFENMVVAIVNIVTSDENMNYLEEHSKSRIVLGKYHSIKELCQGLHPHTIMHGSLDKYGEHSMYLHNCAGIFTTVLEEVNYRANEFINARYNNRSPYTLVVEETSTYYPDSGNIKIEFTVTRPDKFPRRHESIRTQHNKK